MEVVCAFRTLGRSGRDPGCDLPAKARRPACPSPPCGSARACARASGPLGNRTRAAGPLEAFQNSLQVATTIAATTLRVWLDRWRGLPGQADVEPVVGVEPAVGAVPTPRARVSAPLSLATPLRAMLPWRLIVAIAALASVSVCAAEPCASAAWLDRAELGALGDWSVVVRFEPIEVCSPSVPPVLRRLLRLGLRRLWVAARQGSAPEAGGELWDGPPGLDVAVEWNDATSAAAGRAAVAALAGKLGCASARSVADGLRGRGGAVGPIPSIHSESSFVSSGGVCGDALRAWMDLAPPRGTVAAAPAAFEAATARFLSVDVRSDDGRLVAARLSAAAIIPGRARSQPPLDGGSREVAREGLEDAPCPGGRTLRVRCGLAGGRAGSFADPWRHRLVADAVLSASAAAAGGHLALRVALPGGDALATAGGWAELFRLHGADADVDGGLLDAVSTADVEFIRLDRGSVAAGVSVGPETTRGLPVVLRLHVDLAASMPALDDLPFSAARGLEISPPLAEWTPRNLSVRVLRARAPEMLHVRVPLGDEAMPYNVMGIAGVLTTAPLAVALSRLTRCGGGVASGSERERISAKGEGAGRRRAGEGSSTARSRAACARRSGRRPPPPRARPPGSLVARANRALCAFLAGADPDRNIYGLHARPRGGSRARLSAGSRGRRSRASRWWRLSRPF